MSLSITRIIALCAILLASVQTGGGAVVMMEICAGGKVQTIPVTGDDSDGHVTCDTCCIAVDASLLPGIGDIPLPAETAIIPKSPISQLTVPDVRRNAQARAPPFA